MNPPRKPRPIPATQLTMRKLRADGWQLVRKVETWNSFARIRVDLFGFDVIAIGANRQLWVQATSAPNVSTRVAKLQANPDVAVLLGSSPNIRGVVWGWRRNDKGRYELSREVEIKPLVEVSELDW